MFAVRTSCAFDIVDGSLCAFDIVTIPIRELNRTLVLLEFPSDYFVINAISECYINYIDVI